MLGLSRTPFNKLNIHVGAHYNDKPMAVDNFCRNFERLSPAVQSRLTVENDDKASLYSTRELCEDVYSRIGIPVVHDLHHHLFCTGGLTNEEALSMAVKTWGNIKPVVHYSQSRPDEQNDSLNYLMYGNQNNHRIKTPENFLSSSHTRLRTQYKE